MDSDYVLLLKTGQSELKAWASLPSHVRAQILPHIELTRGRKIASRANPKPAVEPDHRHIPGAYGFSKCVDTVAGILRDQEAVVLDITREDSLSCYEIDQLAIAENGYQNWLDFLSEIPLSGHRLYPTVIVNPADNTSPEQYSADLNHQVARLFETYPGICYRASVLADAEFLYDLMLIRETVNNNVEDGRKFILVLDHEYIRPSTGMVHAARTTGLVSSVLELMPGASVVIMATSFPKSIEDIGHEEYDNFPIEERFLFEQVRRNVPANYRVTYGDYGSINPERMDMITRGWRPRIDFPTQNRRTFYYREKREIVGRDSAGKIIYDDYESHYASVAKKVVADSQFQAIENSWGCAQIQRAASDAVPGKNPSFWISVRMEIHIQQMVRTLGTSGSGAISA